MLIKYTRYTINYINYFKAVSCNCQEILFLSYFMYIKGILCQTKFLHFSPKSCSADTKTGGSLAFIKISFL